MLPYKNFLALRELLEDLEDLLELRAAKREEAHAPAMSIEEARKVLSELV
jgi:hypothetical protein